MSRNGLIKVVQRSMNDAEFRRELATDSAKALRGYDLTPDEAGALRTRDAAKLTAFGIDVRMSKVFTLEPGMLGTATLTSEPRDVAPVWIGDGNAARDAIQSPDAIDRNLLLSDATDTTTGGDLQQ